MTVYMTLEDLQAAKSGELRLEISFVNVLGGAEKWEFKPDAVDPTRFFIASRSLSEAVPQVAVAE